MAYIPANRTPVKNRLESKILQYLSDPDNPPLSRTELATKVCGYKDNGALYVHFTGGELSELENRALAIRRSRYSGALMKVDAGILKAGQSGNPGAAKLCYQRFEDWSEKSRVEGVVTFEAVLNQLVGNTPAPIDITPVNPDDPDNPNTPALPGSPDAPDNPEKP